MHFKIRAINKYENENEEFWAAKLTHTVKGFLGFDKSMVKFKSVLSSFFASLLMFESFSSRQKNTGSFILFPFLALTNQTFALFLDMNFWSDWKLSCRLGLFCHYGAWEPTSKPALVPKVKDPIHFSQLHRPVTIMSILTYKAINWYIFGLNMCLYVYLCVFLFLLCPFFICITLELQFLCIWIKISVAQNSFQYNFLATI